MLKINFKTASDNIVTVEGQIGSTLMQAAVDNGIEAIAAECGGACACATCHVHVAPEWMDKVGKPNEYEADMLELEDETTEFSRLACQVVLNEEMNGLTVSVLD